MKNIKRNNKDKYKDINIDLDYYIKRNSHNSIFKFFSYKVNIECLSQVYRYKSYNILLNSFCKKFMLCKWNLFVLINSFIFAILLRVIFWGLLFGFFYLILFLLDSYTNLSKSSINKIYISIIPFAVLIFSFYTYRLVLSSKTKKLINKRNLLDALTQNIKLWFYVKYFIKIEDIVSNLNLLINKEKWNNSIINELNYFLNNSLFLYLEASFYTNVNVENLSIIKIKKYNLNRKVKTFLMSDFLIDSLYLLKLFTAYSYPIIVAVIVNSIYVIR